MKEWLKPEITESEAGMEVTSYLPAELDRVLISGQRRLSSEGRIPGTPLQSRLPPVPPVLR